jgi:glycosyltransferase involved in cell wall biosynthesis
MKIAIYCGEGGGSWNPESLKRGTGGSEQAVIYLARALKGTVRVFNGVKEPYVDGSVTYLNHSSAGSIQFDSLIVWRTPGMILSIPRMKARRKILWLHDLVDEVEVMPFIHHYDRIVVGSRFHRETYPNIPDEKFEVIPLGLDIPALERIGTPERDPWKICYFSAYDRGLRVLLEDWTRLKLTFPKLELVVGYGWETMDRLAVDRQAYGFFHDLIEHMFDQEGITHLGRVSQEQVLTHMARSQLLAYPSIWPETFCLAALQAQAMGAVPVTTPLAALSETVQYGWKKPNEPEWYQAMVDALSHPGDVEFIRSMMVPATRERYSWKSVAEKWRPIL